MKIIINGKTAVLKADTSFDYTLENPDFQGREGYTLGISFPLAGCQENLAIFGHLDRADIVVDRKAYDCRIISAGVSLEGVISIVKISEKEVECQFASGKSAELLASPWEEIYVNELDLGGPDITDPNAINRNDCNLSYDPEEGVTAVCLPWINTDHADVPNNWPGNSYTEWDEEVTRLSWQPYLLHIVKKICEAVGYTYDFHEWESSPHAQLIVCNTLPGSWEMSEYAKALPHWNLDDFFDKLERFLSARFEIDHIAKSIRMQYNCNALKSIPPVRLANVVDSFAEDVTLDAKDSQCNYISHVGLKYKDTGHQCQNFYCCDWFMRKNPATKRYDTIYQLADDNKLRKVPTASKTVMYVYGKSDNAGKLLYAADVDTYFTLRVIDRELRETTHTGRKIYNRLMVLEPVNLFGSWLENDDNALELDFVPVCIDDTYISPSDNKGRMMFLSPGGSDEESSESSDEDALVQPRPTSFILAGDKAGSAEYYSEIYVAYLSHGEARVDDVWLPFTTSEWAPVVSPGNSLRLAHRVKYCLLGENVPGAYPVIDIPYYTDAINNLGVANYPKVDPTVKFSFSWIGHSIPNPRAVFHIRGRKFVCERITVSFTTDGPSQLLKGEFWPIVDTAEES